MYLAAITTVGSSLVVPYDTILYDPLGSCTTGAAAKYTALVDGFYDVITQMRTNAASLSGNYIGKNGNNNIAESSATYTASGQENVLVAIVKLVAGDTIAAYGNGGYTTVGSTSQRDYMVVAFRAPA
ncbi:MAG: hypothetical protein ACRENL_09460 [Candidatus Dormibacteria bacterium]